MSTKSEKKVVLTAVTLASAVAFGTTVAGENPFAMQDLGKDYQVAQKHMDGKCGSDAKASDGKCGADKVKKEAKGKDGKCGEGKCGAKKDDKK